MSTPNPNPSPELRETRNRLSHFEQMNDAQTGCLPCKLCGGKAVVTDAGTGAGYYVRCENSTNFRDYKGCMIDERRLSGWAYNVMEWWNRLHAQTATLPTDAQVREAMQTAWDDYCDDAKAFPGDLTKLSRGRIMFTAGTWADHTAMHLRAVLSPQTLPAPGEVERYAEAFFNAWHPRRWDSIGEPLRNRYREKVPQALAALATVAAANDEGVAELRDLEAMATRGEWSVAEGSVEDGSIYIDADDTGDRPVAMIMSGSPHNQDRADAAFIVAAVAFARARLATSRSQHEGAEYSGSITSL